MKNDDKPMVLTIERKAFEAPEAERLEMFKYICARLQAEFRLVGRFDVEVKEIRWIKTEIPDAEYSGIAIELTCSWPQAAWLHQPYRMMPTS